MKCKQERMMMSRAVQHPSLVSAVKHITALAMSSVILL